MSAYMNIDDYIKRRNDLQLKAEDVSEEAAQRCWTELGVANRHIERVLNGTLPLHVVESEIERCLQRVTDLQREMKS